MKITKRHLRKIIKEEVGKILSEEWGDGHGGNFGNMRTHGGQEEDVIQVKPEMLTQAIEGAKKSGLFRDIANKFDERKYTEKITNLLQNPSFGSHPKGFSKDFVEKYQKSRLPMDPGYESVFYDNIGNWKGELVFDPGNARDNDHIVINAWKSINPRTKKEYPEIIVTVKTKGRVMKMTPDGWKEFPEEYRIIKISD